LTLRLSRSEKGTVDDMSHPTKRMPVVAILNSHRDFIGGLRDALDGEGVPTVAALLSEIQDGTLDLVAFLEAHDPRVIVYDLPRPFERHWNFLRLLRQADAVRKRTWILTTTDKRALDAAVGASGVIEIVFGEPYSIGEVVDAVQHALSDGRPPRPERRHT
jgi:DNA-binding NarL/FixJ family response regulator